MESVLVIILQVVIFFYLSLSFLILAKRTPLLLAKGKIICHKMRLVLALSSFAWPFFAYKDGIGQFFSFLFFDMPPWEYDKQRFERSGRRVLYKNSIYFVYQTTVSKCHDPFSKEEKFLRKLFTDSSKVQFIVAFVPRLGGYLLSIHYSNDEYPEVETDKLPYILDAHANDKRSFDECVELLKSSLKEVPENLVEAMRVPEKVESHHELVFYFHDELSESSQKPKPRLVYSSKEKA